MNHIHNFAPHPTLLLLFCSICGTSQSIAEAAGEARQPVLRPPRRRHREPAAPPVDDEVATAEAELARRVMELPLGETIDDDLRALIERANIAREEERVPVGDDENLGANAGL